MGVRPDVHNQGRLHTRQKKSLLEDPEMYESMIKPQVRLLRSARSHSQFVKMSEIVTDHWIENGEAEYARWFRLVYLVRRWERWHVNGSGIGGLVPSQQGIESHHAVIKKKTCAPSTRASTSGVVDGILPRILRYGGENLCFSRVYHFGVAPVPPEMLAKASALVCNERNYRKLRRGAGASKRLEAVLFNVRKHMVGSAGILESDVDATRARTFMRSLQVDGVEETSNFVGQVVGVRLSRGVFVWSARFDGGSIRDYEAEPLAQAVVKAHGLGVNVTG
ncbi:hypothetical protein PPTG_24458 [Phytophthora nicotianae INRA-310]|uniref:Uncharacterized protein n=1 Tax=Phytophthora nicotianae (strain INRA-310) TaxID=761204 RepID=W2PEI0_PHYN3|nr:hypothetical protein PPTG_24458 [Phytophthora nicotianae INRA-310]ETM99251.1 hypothetical protein PPTG_24458 [Phytophthora nicotianae INRA-310]